ncbi:MAG: lysine--tRNA ligase [Weeksellaceae bacterium]
MSPVADDLIGQRQRRIDAVTKLRELGVDPYPAKAVKDHTNAYVLENFEKLNKKEITLAGRMIANREHGKLIFGDIQDQTGSIQFAIRKDTLIEDLKNGYLGWQHLKLVDVGDFIQLTGEIGKTEQGEVTIFVKHFKLLSKSIRPLPQSLGHKEQQFRRRYLDLVINPERRQVFERKALFFKANRDFLHSKGFMEVEVPVLEHVTGGADARPFITHHNDLDQTFYLRISTELYQKRLIGGQFEKIFTIGPNFRNEGLSDEHLQEYYQIEWYWAYANYQDNMELIKEMFRYIAETVYGKTTFTSREHSFDLAGDWQEIDYVSIIKERFNVDIFNTPDAEMFEILKKEGVQLPGAVNRQRMIDNLWKLIRKTIAGPAFLINEPKFMSPLAKSKPENDALTERFHIVIAGSELGNGYSEINDPQDQLERFLDQQSLRESGDDEAQMLDIDYVEMLEYGMPPVSGYGHSERLFWFLEDLTAREGTLFPQLRHEIDDNTKKIYKDTIKLVTQAKPQQLATTATVDTTGLPSREEALALVESHVQDEYQKLHSRMVAAGMAQLAQDLGENEELWYITGLVHDADYFEHPEEHPKKSLEWFKEKGYPDALIQAVAAHAWQRTEVKPQTKLDYALIACDELSGLLYAYSLMRPERFNGMKASSVMKKFKDKNFAAKIDREEIMLGIDGLGFELSDHMTRLISVFTQMPELNKI